MLKKISVIAVCGFALQGCALTDAELDVGPDMEAVSQGPLSEPGPKTFVMGEFKDAREDTERVGYKKNDFGQNMGDIDTDDPVPAVIIEALEAAAVKNGHSIGDSGISVEGVVNKFWLETDINFTNIEIACNIETDIMFSDTANGQLIYSATYTGSYSDKKQMGTESNFTEIIDGALQALIDEMVFDEDLAEALAGF